MNITHVNLTEEEQKKIEELQKPQRNAKGQFIEGNDGKQCVFCRDHEEIMKKIELFSLWTRGEVDKKLHMPYLQDLCDEDYLDINMDTLKDWIRTPAHDPKHLPLIRTIKKLKMRTEGMLLKRTLGQVASGAIFQLKANYGYMEAEKKILAGDTNEPLNIIITEENKPQYDE